jgi:hypothetical protein
MAPVSLREGWHHAAEQISASPTGRHDLRRQTRHVTAAYPIGMPKRVSEAGMTQKLTFRQSLRKHFLQPEIG